MPNSKCCVPRCLNAYPKAPNGITWHPFPKDEDLAKKWRVKIIGKNAGEMKNGLVCSDHFNENDFETSSRNNIRKVLSSSAVPSIFKEKNDEKITQVDVKPEVDIFHIPIDVWEHIFKFLLSNDIVTLSSVCKHFQRNVQTLIKSFDFSYCYSIDLSRWLNYTLSANYTSINLNHCYRLKPREFLEILKKLKCIQHFHIIECNIGRSCIETIPHLNLTSLSFTYSPQWRAFFLKQANEDTPGFQNLKNLEIFYKKSPSTILIEIYLKVLIHCKELESLKVSECLKDAFHVTRVYAQSIPSRPTPVLKLKTLIVNVQILEDDQNVAIFLNLILKDKVTPLQHVDFGSQSGYLFKTQVLPHPKIQLDKSTFSLNCINTDFNFWINFQPLQNILFSDQPDSNNGIETIRVENVELDGFARFAQNVVVKARKTLKEIHIKQNTHFRNGYFELFDGLTHMTISCHQITVVDITAPHFRWEDNHLFNIILSNATVRKHKALLNALANLKNLEKLAMGPNILHCKYHKSNGEIREKPMPFWKVTTACKHLIEIRIVCTRYYLNKCFVHEDSLYGISFCSKLKVLHLTHFQIQTFTNFILSVITQACDQLEKLYVCGIHGSFKNNYIFGKNMKILNIAKTIKCNETFLDNLSQCEQLEKIYFNKMLFEDSDYEKFASVLRKLKYLSAIFILQKVRKSNNERLDAIFKSLRDERPAFFYSCGKKHFCFKDIPTVHQDLLIIPFQ